MVPKLGNHDPEVDGKEFATNVQGGFVMDGKNVDEAGYLDNT